MKNINHRRSAVGFSKFTLLLLVLAIMALASSASTQQRITWNTQADTLRGKNGQRFTYICPANGTASGRLWGSGLYTDDSSICTAAVHAGVITVVNGGTVTIEIRPGAPSYNGSYRNGLNSRSYGSWGGSFVFVR